MKNFTFPVNFRQPAAFKKTSPILNVKNLAATESGNACFSDFRQPRFLFVNIFTAAYCV
jgi:hypothetical protein